jgi:hypothetical protein
MRDINAAHQPDITVAAAALIHACDHAAGAADPKCRSKYRARARSSKPAVVIEKELR